MQIAEVQKLEKQEVAEWMRLLAKKQFKEAPVDLRYIGGGSFGLVYLATFASRPKPLVFKAFRVSGMHRTQALEIKTLSAHCPLKMPEVYVVHDETPDIPVDAIVMEYVEGVPAVDPRLLFASKNKRRRLGETVVDALLQIHRQTSDRFGYLEDAVYETWTDFYRPIANDIYEWTMAFGAEKGLKKSVIRAIQSAYMHFDEIFDETGPPTLIHADLNVANIMVDPKTLIPTALIDPFHSMWADREYELHQLYNLTGDRFYLYQTYKKRFPVSEKCDLKCAFYALFNEIHCYMLSGVKFDFIFPRQVRNLHRQLRRFGLANDPLTKNRRGY